MPTTIYPSWTTTDCFRSETPRVCLRNNPRQIPVLMKCPSLNPVLTRDSLDPVWNRDSLILVLNRDNHRWMKRSLRQNIVVVQITIQTQALNHILIHKKQHYKNIIYMIVL